MSDVVDSGCILINKAVNRFNFIKKSELEKNDYTFLGVSYQYYATQEYTFDLDGFKFKPSTHEVYYNREFLEFYYNFLETYDGK